MAKKKKADEAQAEVEATGAQPSGPEPVTLRSHPAAMASIRRVRARAGLGAFVLVVLMSRHSGLPLPDATVRGLAAGIAVQLVAWKVAVIVWRQLVLLQVRDLEAAHAERRRERAEAAAERARAAQAAQAA
jgi:hypothetical protein